MKLKAIWNVIINCKTGTAFTLILQWNNILVIDTNNSHIAIIIDCNYLLAIEILIA